MKFCIPALRSFGFGKKSLAPKINEEAEYISEEITKSNEFPFNPVHIFRTATSNIICQLVFGRRFEYDDPDFQRVLRSLNNLLKLSENDPVMVFPFLMNTPWYKDVRQNMLDIKHFIMSELMAHCDTFQKGNIRDFVDAFLADDNISMDFTIEEFSNVVFDLFEGGTDTTAALLSWAILYTAVHPEVQIKVCRL